MISGIVCSDRFRAGTWGSLAEATIQGILNKMYGYPGAEPPSFPYHSGLFTSLSPDVPPCADTTGNVGYYALFRKSVCRIQIHIVGDTRYGNGIKCAWMF